MDKSDRIALIFWGTLGVALAWLKISNLELVGNHTDFGAEYGNIAASLVQGRGFAGAFEASSQPTSWMPPLLPFLLAAVFQIGGVKTIASAQILVGFRMLSLLATLYCLRLLSRELSVRPWLVSLVFALLAGLDFVSSQTPFHDGPFLGFLLSLTLLACLRFRRGQWRLAAAVGLVVPLASPAILFGFVVLVLASRMDTRKTALVLVACALPLSAWCTRNAVVLGGFVPIKSNLWFDFHQANLLDRDGVNGSSTFNRYHPVGASPAVLNAYRDQGEIQFNRSHRKECLRLLKERPLVYLSKVVHRLANATLFLHPVNDVRASELELPAAVQARLVRQKLAMGGSPRMFWNCLEVSPQEAQALFGSFPGQGESLMADWSRARAVMESEHSGWGLALWGWLHSFLPTLAILAGFLRAEVRRQPGFRFTVGLYGLYLLPYVAVSHYERYQMPLIGLMALLVGLAWWKPTKKNPPPESEGTSGP